MSPKLFGQQQGRRRGLDAPLPRFQSVKEGTLGMVRLVTRGADGVAGGVSSDRPPPPPYFLQHLLASVCTSSIAVRACRVNRKR